MTDEQFERLMKKLERIEALLYGVDPNSVYKIPQHLWTEAERLTVRQMQQNR